MHSRRPSAALVVSLVALFVALGGTATAARLLITTREIKNGTIRLVDLSPSTRAALRGATHTGAIDDDAAGGRPIRAASEPVPGYLYPLGPDARFPGSVLPDVTARVYASGDQAALTQAPSGPVKLLTFDRESFDSANLFDPAHPTRLTAPAAGVYVITTNVSWEPFRTDGINRAVYVYVNGHTIAVDQRPPAGETRQTVTTLYRLARGDDVEVGIAHDAWGSLTANAVGDYAPSLAMAWIASG
jgi:hypothetical protein